MPRRSPGAETSAEQGKAGTVLRADAQAGLIISCGTDSIRILEMQAPGGKKMRAEDYLRGHAIPAGTEWNEPAEAGSEEG